MNTLSNISELIGIFNMIPEGTDQRVCINDLEIALSKKDGVIDVKIGLNEDNCEGESVNYKFDDSEIKEKVANYKESIDILDDNIFLDILDEMREVIDIKEFDELLDATSFTEETAARVEELIDHSTLIVHKFLQNKIQNLMELYERF